MTPPWLYNTPVTLLYSSHQPHQHEIPHETTQCDQQQQQQQNSHFYLSTNTLSTPIAKGKEDRAQDPKA